jgi:hypothetical protein
MKASKEEKMNWLLILKYIAVAVTLVTGVISIVMPASIKGFTGLEASSPRATSEIRAVMGGVFLGLAVAVLIFRTPEVFKMLGIAFAAIAVVRALSIVFDHAAVQSNVISLISEIALAVILLL